MGADEGTGAVWRKRMIGPSKPQSPIDKQAFMQGWFSARDKGSLGDNPYEYKEKYDWWGYGFKRRMWHMGGLSRPSDEGDLESLLLSELERHASQE